MKSKKIMLALVSMFALTGCDALGDLFGGGGGGDSGKSDTTLYHLTLTSNIQLTDAQKEELKALIAFGVDGSEIEVGPRNQDEIDSLLTDGAKQADINKAGDRQLDGTYYFFDGDPMFLNAPEVEGYTLNGFFYPTDTDNSDPKYRPGLAGPDFKHYDRWNMEGNDVTLEARYTKSSYDVVYGFQDDLGHDVNGVVHSNPSHYCFIDDGATKGVLSDPTSYPDYLDFDHWQCIEEGNLFAATELPHTYEHSSLFLTGVFNRKQYTVTIVWDPTKGNVTLTESTNEKLKSTTLGTDQGKTKNEYKIPYNEYFSFYATSLVDTDEHRASVKVNGEFKFNLFVEEAKGFEIKGETLIEVEFIE